MTRRCVVLLLIGSVLTLHAQPPNRRARGPIVGKAVLRLRIGLDGIIGLIPVVGDLLTILIGGIILQEAKRLGVSRWTRFRMYANYAIDLLVGSVPVVGCPA